METEDFKLKVTRIYSAEESKKILAALLLMIEVHRGQTRAPQNTPYAGHPLTVATKVLDFLESPDYELIIVALLHDTVEDQAEKLAHKYSAENNVNQRFSTQEKALLYLASAFGNRVRDLVNRLTNPDFELALEKEGITPKDLHFIIQRNSLYAKHIEEITENPDAFIVKCADFLSNTEDLKQLADSPKKSYLLKKYAPIPDILLHALTVAHTINLKKTAKAEIENGLETIRRYIETSPL